MFWIFISTGLLIVLHQMIWYLISLVKKRMDVADIAWGIGFASVAISLFIMYPMGGYNLPVYTAVIAWGIRLAIHIGRRNNQKKEDYRYRQWREDWGDTIYWRSFLQVFLLQGFFMWIIAAPLMVAAAAAEHSDGKITLFFSNNLDGKLFLTVGLLVWLIGFLLQSVADDQLRRFIKTKTEGEILKTGLWKYSRHPNYFGEIVMWWGLFIMVVYLPGGGWALASPVLITYLVIFVSGVPMLENKKLGNSTYETYKKHTSMLIPWFPKKQPTI